MNKRKRKKRTGKAWRLYIERMNRANAAIFKMQCALATLNRTLASLPESVKALFHRPAEPTPRPVFMEPENFYQPVILPPLTAEEIKAP